MKERKRNTDCVHRGISTMESIRLFLRLRVCSLLSALLPMTIFTDDIADGFKMIRHTHTHHPSHCAFVWLWTMRVSRSMRSRNADIWWWIDPLCPARIHVLTVGSFFFSVNHSEEKMFSSDNKSIFSLMKTTTKKVKSRQPIVLEHFEQCWRSHSHKIIVFTWVGQNSLAVQWSETGRWRRWLKDG